MAGATLTESSGVRLLAAALTAGVAGVMGGVTGAALRTLIDELFRLVWEVACDAGGFCDPGDAALVDPMAAS